MTNIRVWWMPQVPCKSFYVYVEDIFEAVKIMRTLALYDEFQFENDIKPDYSNMGGVQVIGEDGDWEDWEFFDEISGETYDDPEEFFDKVNEKIKQALS